MYKICFSSVTKLLAFSAFTFLSCEEMDDPVSTQNDGKNSDWPRISIEEPELKIIQIGDDKIAYHAYSDGTNLIEGDIAISDAMLNRLHELSRDPNAHIDDIAKKSSLINGKTTGNGFAQNSIWSGGTYYYLVNPQLPASAVIEIDKAINNWNQKLSLNFVQITQPRNGPYVYFTASPNPTCFWADRFSSEGRGYIYLAPDCSAAAGIITHEIGHSLGLNHEHQRPDRDAHIFVWWNNINERVKPQYRLINNLVINDNPGTKGFATFNLGSFDYNSIMIYNSFNDNDAINDSKPVLTKAYPRDPYTKSGNITQSDVNTVEYMLSGRAANQYVAAPRAVADWQPWSSREGDVVVTWNAVPGATDYIIYIPFYVGEFLSYRFGASTRNRSYTFEVDTEDLNSFRVRVAASNGSGGYSQAFEADYDWK